MVQFIRIFLLALFVAGLSTPLAAHPGIGLVMDSQGNVYYTDLVHVWRISPSGERGIAVSNVHTHELYIDQYDNLYGEHEWYEGEATDKWGNYVWCLKNDGRLIKTIDDVEGFLDNTTLVRDSSGNSYWVDKMGDKELLMKEDPSGKNALFSAHRFNDIRWLYFSKHNENLYVIDNLEVKEVSPTGEVRTIANNLKEGGFSLNKVADRHYVFSPFTNEKGDVFVAVYGTGKIVKLRNDNSMHTIYESPTGWSPCSGMFDDAGNLWIMEFSVLNKTRVSKIASNGTQTIFDK